MSQDASSEAEEWGWRETSYQSFFDDKRKGKQVYPYSNITSIRQLPVKLLTFKIEIRESIFQFPSFAEKHPECGESTDEFRFYHKILYWLIMINWFNEILHRLLSTPTTQVFFVYWISPQIEGSWVIVFLKCYNVAAWNKRNHPR